MTELIPLTQADVTEKREFDTPLAPDYEFHLGDFREEKPRPVPVVRKGEVE